jgi:hypothetical protein
MRDGQLYGFEEELAETAALDRARRQNLEAVVVLVRHYLGEKATISCVPLEKVRAIASSAKTPAELGKAFVLAMCETFGVEELRYNFPEDPRPREPMYDKAGNVVCYTRVGYLEDYMHVAGVPERLDWERRSNGRRRS